MAEQQKVIRKLRAILSDDVKGYSRLMSEDESYTIEKLKEYQEKQPQNKNGSIKVKMREERKYSFEIPPEPIPESEITDIIETEVVVIGAGTAGFRERQIRSRHFSIS